MTETGAAPVATSPSAGEVDVAVIGAGQAGLAVGQDLKGQGRRFVILERAGELAPAWRERWESLTLFTLRRYGALPGVPFPGDPDGYPDPRRGHRLPRALRRDVRASGRARQRHRAAREGDRAAGQTRVREEV
jgi:cation diffusion facilitator CzcD-associated flavoprotein CzcO